MKNICKILVSKHQGKVYIGEWELDVDGRIILSDVK
jgi:hypothetical protein